MNKIILEAKNKAELEELIKKNINLEKDETYEIKEIKKPLDLFVFKIKGKYEISIIKKTDKKEKVELKPKKNEKKEKIEKNEIDERIRQKLKEFFNKAELQINITDITNEGKYKIVNLEGKDIRYIIGEKGLALSSLETLINNTKEWDSYKLVLDSNNYKSKREETLRNLASKKAQKVLETKSRIKLSPMTSRERKIIHEEISKYPNLSTESYGVDPKRYLVIKYKED